MLAILDIVLPVFLLVGAGYVAARSHAFPDAGIEGLIIYVNRFASPVLLFRAMLTLDLGKTFAPQFLISFYAGAFICFALGIFGARVMFKRRPGEAVAVGFAGYFTNTLLLGLPIVHRAYGEAGTTWLFAIVGLHAPVLLTFATIVMELARRDGAKLGPTLARMGKGILSNALMIGIFCGILGNVLGLRLPDPVDVATKMMADSVLPAALFGVGAALTRYRLRDEIAEATMASTLKLLVHPAIAYVLAYHVFSLSPEAARVAVLTAAMPAGLNVYIFATLYDRATGVAASTVLLSTALGIVTISGWLYVLGP